MACLFITNASSINREGSAIEEPFSTQQATKNALCKNPCSRRNPSHIPDKNTTYINPPVNTSSVRTREQHCVDNLRHL